MPRPTKRTIASRQSAQSTTLGKRRRLSDSEVSNILSDSDSDSPSDPEEGIAVSEAEDSDSESESEREQDLATVRLPIAQPDKGWKAAERTLPGYSKTNARKTKQSSYYYNKKEKEKERERKELQQTYGDISRFFDRPTPQPRTILPSLPDFEGSFFKAESFAVEAEQLDSWLKSHKAEVTGDWLKRVQGVQDLLRFQGSFLYSATDDVKERKAKWMEYSKGVAVRLGKGPKFAQYLRGWEQDWFNARTPPPCPMKGRYVKRQSLFTDEGVSDAIHEFYC